MYYVYVLESVEDKSWYIGYTSNLKTRVKEHNSGKSRYTNQHKPYKLVYYMGFVLKSDAKRVEIYLKSGNGRRVLRNFISDYLKSNN